MRTDGKKLTFIGLYVYYYAVSFQSKTVMLLYTNDLLLSSYIIIISAK